MSDMHPERDDASAADPAQNPSESAEKRDSSASTARGRIPVGPLVMHPACGFALPEGWITLGPDQPRIDPRPGARVAQDAGIGGVLKQRPEDFIVEEIPSYTPSGEGEHIYLGVQKTNMPHTEMLAVLGRHFHVDESAIGFAGMKDRVAVTHQTVSIHLPVDRPVGELRHERLALMWSKRHSNKLRRGHLRGNRFSIRIRDVDPMQVRSVKKRMEELAVRGIPDYFGDQRFGYRVNNQLLGLLHARGDAQATLDEMLGARGTPFPPHQLATRELYERGEFEASAASWGHNDQAERIALRALARGRDASGAVRAIPGHMKNFWLSALQGAIYNEVLNARVIDGSFAEILPGDVAVLAGKSSIFPISGDVDAEELASLQARCVALDLSPTGPIHGPKMIQPQGRPLTMEQAALARVGAELSMFTPPILEGDGARRPLRITMTDWAVDAGVDENGGYIRMQFDLPKGAFATVLCREIMGVSVE